ncbi:MAG TPA: 4-alpha-glucanotransferase [Ilumatobacteraceae bacterium]|nr:4-alpha-glucanotransferase [Ilumatobacteraceae bacterium]
MTDEALFARASELGVQTEYHDVAGQHHRADRAALAHVVAILEADRQAVASVPRIGPPLHLAAAGPVRIDARVRHATITVQGAPTPVELRHDGHRSEIVVPGDLPAGCHILEVDTEAGPGETVVVVAPATMPRDRRFAGTGGLFVPTYALWERDRPLPSFDHLHRLARALKAAGIDIVSTLPLYATFLDEPFDPSPYSPISRLHWNELYLDDAGLPPAPIPAQDSHLDWRTLAARRRAQLIEAARSTDATLDAHLTAFVAAHPDIGAYARFRAAREAGGDEIVERSHVLAQYLADLQLTAIADDPDAAALALDLPIGSSPEGFEVWADPSMFAAGASVGAPPDSFFADGQDWGFPPPLPGAMHASGHRLWRQLIERVGRYADILRVDHAMAIERLWWVPEGFSADRGVYVHYPREDLLAVIAASAAAAGVTIVGEDLGTVPVEVSDAFERWDVLGMYEEQFHLDDDPLPHIPARTVAGIRTHDMEPLAAFVAGHDTAGYRARLGAAHAATIDDRWDHVVDHMLVRLAASDAYMVMADLDDLVGEMRPHNLPGRIVEGLWARRLDHPTSEVLADPDVCRRLSILGRPPS